MSKRYAAKTPHDLMNYYVNLYYVTLIENPDLKSDHSLHLAKVKEIEAEYLGHLEWFKWDNAETRVAFRNLMDYLTKVFKKEADIKALSDKKRNLFAELKA